MRRIKRVQAGTVRKHAKLQHPALFINSGLNTYQDSKMYQKRHVYKQLNAMLQQVGLGISLAFEFKYQCNYTATVINRKTLSTYVYQYIKLFVCPDNRLIVCSSVNPSIDFSIYLQIFLFFHLFSIVSYLIMLK